jgi:hypothetical protein
MTEDPAHGESIDEQLADRPGCLELLVRAAVPPRWLQMVAVTPEDSPIQTDRRLAPGAELAVELIQGSPVDQLNADGAAVHILLPVPARLAGVPGDHVQRHQLRNRPVTVDHYAGGNADLAVRVGEGGDRPRGRATIRGMDQDAVRPASSEGVTLVGWRRTRPNRPSGNGRGSQPGAGSRPAQSAARCCHRVTSHSQAPAMPLMAPACRGARPGEAHG